MTDDDDIYRQCCKLYIKANTLARKFQSCSVAVKVALFKAYCTPLCTAHLWTNYKKASMQRLQVAYNDALQAVLRNLMYRFICQLDASKNEIILSVTNIRYSTVRYQSRCWRHWYKCLFLDLKTL